MVKPQKAESYLDKIRQLLPEQRMLYWITEREKIRVNRKYAATTIISDDPILTTYRFCNVRRMDDRVSKWLMDNWYKPFYGHKNMVYACALARHFNKISTLDAIGFPKTIDPKRTEKTLRKLWATRGPVFNAAYIITGKLANGQDKINTVLYHTLDQFVSNPIQSDLSSMEALVTEMVSDYSLIGTFMAGQIAADMRWGTTGTFKDKNTWAAIGPGSRRGMNRYLSRPVGSPMGQEEFNGHLAEFMAFARKMLPAITKRLEAIDFQNCFCEYDKYSRTLLGEGKPKQKYRPYGV